MTHCVVCGVHSMEAVLYDGIWQGSIQKVCEKCAKREGITIIKKPTEEQIAESKRISSVKEIMSKLSGDKKTVYKEDYIAHKNLAKLHFPKRKQESDDLVYNYDWILRNSRRRKKISVSQLSQATGIEKEKIDQLEQGQLFEGFQEAAHKIQNYLGVNVIKGQEVITRLKLNHEDLEKKEKEILAAVKQKVESQKKRGIFSKENIPEDYGWSEEELNSEGGKVVKHEEIDLDYIRSSKFEEAEERKEKQKAEIEAGELDFSNKENIEDITIQDLVEIKKKREGKK